MTVQPQSSRFSVAVSAFFYLQVMTLGNKLRRSLLRIRQPKYLLGALAALVYFYWFFFRHLLGGDLSREGMAELINPALLVVLPTVTAILLLLFVLLDWLLAGEGAPLGFNESEIDFLFPAPLSRTTLIQYSLLRSQPGIILSSLLIGLLLHRGVGHPVQHVVGLWLMLSVSRLYTVAAAFSRERLRCMGMGIGLRRAIVLLVIVGLGYWCVRLFQMAPAPFDDDVLTKREMVLAWGQGVVLHSPLVWVLLPFQWLTAPIFAADLRLFIHALPQALALLGILYFWAVRAQVSFEEASIAKAERRAALVAAAKQGRLGLGRPKKAKAEPFALHAKGRQAVAFLWEELLALGPLYRLRSWLIACGIVFASAQLFAAKVAWSKPVLLGVAAVSLVVAAYALVFAPMIRQYRLLRFLEQLDVLRSMPLTGQQIALGQLLSPTIVMSFALWLLLWTAAVCSIIAGGAQMMTPARIVAATLGVALWVPPLSGLMLSVPLAGALYFPAWAQALGGGPKGVEVMGQRLIFMAGYMLALLLALVPATLLAGLAFFLVNAIWGLVPGFVVVFVCVFIVLVLELGWVLEQFGDRVEQLDISQELR